MGTHGDRCPTAVPPPGAGRGDSRLMPNLERCPHLLSAMSMTERKREAKTAKATATETWGQKEWWGWGWGPGAKPRTAPFSQPWHCRWSQIYWGKLRHRGGQEAAFILSHPTSPCLRFAFTLRTALLSHRCPCVPFPKSQSTPSQPSPHPKCVLVRCLHGALQRAVPGACVGRGHRVGVGWGRILTPAQSLHPHHGASPSHHSWGGSEQGEQRAPALTQWRYGHCAAWKRERAHVNHLPPMRESHVSFPLLGETEARGGTEPLGRVGTEGLVPQCQDRGSTSPSAPL